nr:hypothetical protein GCM10025699_44510 [Microbacterium flavescens]
MTAGGPVAHRNSLGRSLGLGERLFATPAERRFVAAVDDGLELVEEGLLREIAFADEIADATTRYLLAAGGKRVRPTLTLLIAQLGEGATPASSPPPRRPRSRIWPRSTTTTSWTRRRCAAASPARRPSGATTSPS